MADKLVCARALTATLVAKGTTFDRRCVACGQNVCVAPSSLAVLALNPKLEIICLNCIKPQAGDELIFPPAAVEEAMRALRGGK